VALLSIGHVSAQAPGFEVASVRRGATRAADLTKTGDRRGAAGGFEVEHTRFTATDVSLYGLIVKAYGLSACRPFVGQCVLLSGGPDWLRKETFDVRAKAPDGSPDYDLIQFLNGRAPQLQVMLRTLLEDRFHLKVHTEKRQLPVYILTKGAKPPKLRPADPAEESRIAFRPSVQSNGDKTIQLFSQNGSME
jgi:uncharacterized protein (TIGR03435 family)